MYRLMDGIQIRLSMSKDNRCCAKSTQQFTKLNLELSLGVIYFPLFQSIEREIAFVTSSNLNHNS